MPVVIPQRRPNSRHRGFVRAYAPILEQANVSQTACLDFLSGFEKTISANPWFEVVNIALGIADIAHMAVEGFSVITYAAVIAFQLSIEAGRQTYLNYKQKNYLDAIKEDFFKPRDLFCLVIKYKPGSGALYESVDVERNVAAPFVKRDDEDRRIRRNFFTASAATNRSEEELPEFAPLVFPGLDGLSEQQKKGATTVFGHFIHDYFDRQSQAKFDVEYPDSKLVGLVPRKEFASRYADPSHPASQGGLRAFVSVGHIPATAGVLSGRRQRRRGTMGILGNDKSVRRGEKKSRRPIKRLLKENALYLMVVNMPSQKQIDAIMAAMEKGRSS